MPRSFITVFLLVCAFLVGACETVIDVDLPEHEPLLVVNSLFRANEPLTVDLGQSVGLEDPMVWEVENARLTLFEDGKLMGDLTPDSAGNLYGSGTAPVPGRTYTLRVSAPGFDPVEASDTVPEQPAVTVTTRLSSEQPYEWSEKYDVTIRLEDPPEEENYYAIWISGTPYVGDIPRENPGFAWTTRFRSRDPLLRDGAQTGLFEAEVDYEVAQFSDRAIDGKSYEIRLETDLSRPFVFPDTNHVTFSRYYITVRAISEPFYRHLKATQKIDESTPFDEPVQLPSNIKGGLGIFAASNGVDYFIADVYPGP